MSDAIDGAKDIIAEQISENEQARNTIRAEYRRNAVITSKIVKKRADDEDALKFQSYFDFSKPLKRVSSHQLLAMRRGESAGVLRIKISSDDEECVYRLKRQFVRGHGPCQKIVGEATEDAFKRLIAPSIENEFAVSSKEVADEEAINVFEDNLRQLLLSPPLGQKRTMAIDPGYANGLCAPGHRVCRRMRDDRRESGTRSRAGRMGVDNLVVDEVALSVETRYLASVGIAGVDGHGALLTQWG